MIRAVVPGSERCRTITPVTAPLDGFPFSFQQPDAIDYILGYDWPFAGRIAELRITADAGSGLCSVLINGVPVTGITNVPIAAGIRSRHTAEASNLFAVGNDMVLRIVSGPPGLLNVRGTLVITL